MEKRLKIYYFFFHKPKKKERKKRNLFLGFQTLPPPHSATTIHGLTFHSVTSPLTT